MRLIDADAIKYIDLNRDVKNNLKVFVAFKEDVDALPTIEAAQVVRCKDCKHWHIDSHCDGYRSADDFCSWGERSEP